jgi:hypothetical protein
MIYITGTGTVSHVLLLQRKGVIQRTFAAKSDSNGSETVLVETQNGSALRDGSPSDIQPFSENDIAFSGKGRRENGCLDITHKFY